ncbi:MAG: hypothetical protein ACK52J_01460 [bacterium]
MCLAALHSGVITAKGGPLSFKIDPP